MNSTDIWSFDLLNSMPEINMDQAKRLWLELKDSEKPSDRDKLSLLYAKLVFQEICRTCAKYSLDERYVFSTFPMKFVLNECSGNLDNVFFWADLHEITNRECMNSYKWLRNGNRIKRTQYEIIVSMMALSFDKKTRGDIIKDASLLKESNDIEQECLTLIYEELQMNLARKTARKIAQKIIHIAALRARKRVKGKGWLCGTYANAIQKGIERKLVFSFSYDELKFIAEHLGDDNDSLVLQPRGMEQKELCEQLTKSLNALVPELYMNPIIDRN